MNPSKKARRPRERVEALLGELVDLTVTTEQAAAIRQVKPRSITQAVWRGDLEPIPLTSERRFLRVDVEQTS